MKPKFKDILISSWLVGSLLWPTVLAGAQQATFQATFDLASDNEDGHQSTKALLNQARGAELAVLFERLFGDEAAAAAEALDSDAEPLVEAVSIAASEKAEEQLDEQIEERKMKTAKPPTILPQVKTSPPKPSVKPSAKQPVKPSVKKPVKQTPAKATKTGFNKPWGTPRETYFRPVAFGFQLIDQQEQAPAAKPEIEITETDKEIKAEGSDKKSFETKEAKGTQTEKAETRYLKDGKTFGVEIKNVKNIEAVSKLDGKSFRSELSLAWGAEVAACPDSNGITVGTGKAKVTSKTIYTEDGQTVTTTSQFDLGAKLTGYVNDQAEMTHYDLVLDAYAENSGYEEALARKIIKEIKIKDGKYGLHYDILGNTIEVSDGTYGGKRTPAKMGEVTAKVLTPMSDAEITVIGKAFGPMVPSIWNSANEMYKTAQAHWRNYGCVEVACTVPKLALKPDEAVSISAETLHLQDKGKINAELTAEAYQGQVTPESQRATPTAKFTFTREGEENPSFHAESVSKRGIGKGNIEFQIEKEKVEPAQAGAWTGTINAQRTQREEREKRSGANLAENGGYLETKTEIHLKLTGRLDRSVEATNAHIAMVSGEQEQVDYEYDKYKVDEGYCGPNAVPYKGPKEITRTSRTTVNYNKETRVYVEAGQTEGSITFSLPEQNGRTIHSYVHKSPCAQHDRANTNEAIDEDVAATGGSFAFSFSVAPAQKTIKGSTTVREEDGSTTTYRWELERG